MSSDVRRWPDWLGGVAFVLPFAISLGLAAFYGNDSKAGGVVALVVVVSELLLEALVAPLVGYRRTYVLWSFVPFWGWTIAWTIGTRLARLSNTGTWEVKGSRPRAVGEIPADSTI